MLLYLCTFYIHDNIIYYVLYQFITVVHVLNVPLAESHIIIYLCIYINITIYYNVPVQKGIGTYDYSDLTNESRLL